MLWHLSCNCVIVVYCLCNYHTILKIKLLINTLFNIYFKLFCLISSLQNYKRNVVFLRAERKRVSLGVAAEDVRHPIAGMGLN